MQEIIEFEGQIPYQMRDLSGWRDRIGYWVGRIFACWRHELGIPFTDMGETYRVCIKCGAQRRFMPDSWTTVGSYYFRAAAPPAKPHTLSVRLVPTVPEQSAQSPVYPVQPFLPPEGVYDSTQIH